MKTLGTSLCIIAGLIVIGLLILAVLTSSRHEQPLDTFKDFPGLISAINAFSRDVTNRGQPLPQSVSLNELVNRNYIASNSVSAFNGMDTQIWLTADPRSVDSVLMSARLPDGTVCAALGDGSVQQFSPQRFAEQLRKAGQQLRFGSDLDKSK